MKSKKLLTSVVALGTAAALALGGTFAWQSISQTALNERSDIVNPGGRLHDDFDGSNKDVYVENFADEDIFARIRLEEYFEIVMNYGSDAEVVDVLVGDRTEDMETGEITRTGSTFIFDECLNDDGTVNAGVKDGDAWWTWTTGGSTVFMPTFNLNKDSLVADINGYYKLTNEITEDNGDGEQYTEMDTYEVGDEKTVNAIYDADTNKLDELTREDVADVIENGEAAENYATFENNIKLVTETHTAKSTGTTAGLISMTEWLALKDAGEETGNYWVYDTDGWVYWSSPIKAGEATGLLLDGIALNQVMDDTWYYFINVVGQFVTANDVGKANSTGFYADGETVSENAETLLKTIGVQFADDTTGDDEETTDITINSGDTAAVTYSRRAPGEYALVAEGFGENVTYTVTGAQRCKVTADNKLTVNKWESASSFTVTAEDEDGNTGTVTIKPTGTTPTDNPIFELYKVTDSGNEYMQRLTDDAVTLNVRVGEKYHISVDFAARDDIEYLFALGEVETDDIVDTDEIAFIKSYGKDHVARVYTERSHDGYFYAGILEMNIEIYEAAAGKTYDLGGGGHNDDGIEGSLDITFIVAAATGDDGEETAYDLRMSKDEDSFSFLSVSLGDKVNLQDENGNALTGTPDEVKLLKTDTNVELSSGSDYAFSDGVLELLASSEQLSAGRVVRVDSDDYCAFLLVDADNALTLLGGIYNLDEFDDVPAYGAIAAISGEIQVQLADDSYPGSLTVKVWADSTLTPDDDYTYDSSTGVLKITNVEYANKMLQVTNADSTEDSNGRVKQAGYLFVQST